MADENKTETKRDRFMRLYMALLYERKAGKWIISVGRVSWWLTLAPALYIWTMLDRDITPNHAMLLITLAAYNLGKHGLDMLRSKSEAASEADKEA